MCQLFGLSASQRIAGSALPLAEFQARGGATVDNPDGWGVAWRDEAIFRLGREPQPGHRSERFGNVIETIHSDLLIAHVRKARWPPVNTLGNTHPFVHSCCRQWVFAHNGLVPELVTMESANQAKACRPVGETDSEFAFCHLLSHVMGYYPTPSAETPWLEVLATISELIAGHGKFNFLLSDGEHLFAYGHDRLHRLESHDGGVDVAFVAAEPLGSGVGWTAFEAGELRIYRVGVSAWRWGEFRHKFYTPKGVGALYVRAGTPIRSVLHGAEQEHGLRPGTENVASIVALGAAAVAAQRSLPTASEHMREMRDHLHRRLAAAIPELKLNGHPEHRLPNTLHVSFPGVSGRALLGEAADAVAASVGSACHSERDAVSGVLAAMGADAARAAGAVRLSVGRGTTLDEIERAAEALVCAWQQIHTR